MCRRAVSPPYGCEDVILCLSTRQSRERRSLTPYSARVWCMKNRYSPPCATCPTHDRTGPDRYIIFYHGCAPPSRCCPSAVCVCVCVCDQFCDRMPFPLLFHCQLPSHHSAARRAIRTRDRTPAPYISLVGARCVRVRTHLTTCLLYTSPSPRDS